jgi:RNA polymerase sigma-B factor
VARNLARRYTHRGVPLEDLTQVATLGLINAIDRYDPERGAEFLAFAIPTVQGEIRRYFRDLTWSMRVPRQLKERYPRIGNATALLSQRLGQAPRPSEIAAHLGITIDEVLEALAASTAYTATSLDRQLDTADSDDAATLALVLGEDDPALEQVEIHHLLRPLLAGLPARERDILLLRFYANLTQSQIGDRIGISQMHVSRLLSRTLERLREQLTTDA